MKDTANEGFARHVQHVLMQTGDYPGPLDGWAGARTRAAFDAAMARAGRAGAPDAPLTASVAGWDDRSAKNLRGVHNDLVRVMTRAREISPVKFVVIEGLRTVERQRQLVAAGASKTMNSRHITGHAVDIVPFDSTGRLAFDWPLYHRLAPAVKQAADDLGVKIVWGGDWRTFKDGPHFELDRAVYPA
jgi:peptidoglycan LD-endopeptidase CwlK